MNELIKLTNNPFFRAFIGDRGLRVYKYEVDGRLGLTGLSKLVLKATGYALKNDEAYVFVVKNRDVVKILTKDYGGISLVEVHDEQVSGLRGRLFG